MAFAIEKSGITQLPLFLHGSNAMGLPLIRHLSAAATSNHDYCRPTPDPESR